MLGVEYNEQNTKVGVRESQQANNKLSGTISVPFDTSLYEEEDLKYCKVRPVNFGTQHRHLMSNMISVVSKGYVAIDPRFQELIQQLRIAKMDDNLALIKKVHSLDLVDSFRLNLCGGVCMNSNKKRKI